MTESRSLGTTAFPIGAMRPTIGGAYQKPNRTTHDGAKSKAVMDAEQAEARDAMPMLTRCAHCPDWTFDGTAGEARVAWVEHATSAHPTIRLRKSRRSAKTASELQREAAMVVAAERAARRAAA